jgi:hypothetical protein
MPDDRNICKTCLMPVSRVFESPGPNAPREEWTFRGWEHVERPPKDGHAPEPIPAHEAPFIDQLCDFCGEPNIAWIFPTDPTKSRTVHGVTFHGEEAWAACQLCHDAVLAATSGHDLVRRIKHRSLPLRQVPRNHILPVMGVMGEQYQHFLDNRVGDPTTLSEYVS